MSFRSGSDRSVNGEVGRCVRGMYWRGWGGGLLAVIDALVVAKAVEAGVDSSAYIADWFARRPHVNILDVPFQAGQRGKALVARLASVFVRGSTTWWAHNHSTLALRSHHLSVFFWVFNGFSPLSIYYAFVSPSTTAITFRSQVTWVF